MPNNHRDLSNRQIRTRRRMARAISGLCVLGLIFLLVEAFARIDNEPLGGFPVVDLIPPVPNEVAGFLAAVLAACAVLAIDISGRLNQTEYLKQIEMRFQDRLSTLEDAQKTASRADVDKKARDEKIEGLLNNLEKLLEAQNKEVEESTQSSPSNQSADSPDS